MSKKPPNYWTLGRIRETTLALCEKLGHFPNSGELKFLKIHDLSAAISHHYNGGYRQLALDLGFEPKKTRWEFGNQNEINVKSILEDKGFLCQKMHNSCPYDLLVGGILRIDVKSSKYSDYGSVKGWFYKIQKAPQSDIILCFRPDQNDVFIFPWFISPNTNITISSNPNVHANYHNRYDIIEEMLKIRKLEQKKYPELDYVNKNHVPSKKWLNEQ